MDRRAGMAAPPARRVRFLLPGVLALAVLAGGSLYLARGELFAGPASSRATVNPRATAAGCDAAAASACPGNPAYLAIAAPPAVVTVPPRPARTSPSASASSRSPSPRPTAPSASASPSSAAGGTAAAQVLALINQARSAAGLPGLTITAGLETSSSQHNLADGRRLRALSSVPGRAAAR